MRKTSLALTLAVCTVLTACEAEELLEPVGSANAVVVPANETGSQVTVLSRNIYLGFDIDQLLAGLMPMDEALTRLQATDFPARAAALAAEIQAAAPALIGLQEVINYRMQDPGDFLSTGVPNAETPMIPFLYILQQALAAYGLDYEVAVEHPTTDVEVPFQTGPSSYIDIRYTDSDVILVRSDVEVVDVTTQLYDDMLTFDLGGLPGSRPLSFVAVEAVVDDAPLLFVSTHLETQNYPAIQEAQTRQLIKWTQKQKLPIVMVGDFNSAANVGAPADRYTRTYDMLLKYGSFEDLWVTTHGDAAGLTCCYEPNLLSATPGFDQRIDLILMDKVAARMVSDVDLSIVGIDAFQSEQPRWASDHAGLVATLTFAPKK